MSTSIAQSRQQLSSLIEAAQSQPQVITKRNTPIAVLVSAEYFKHTQAQRPVAGNYYDTLMSLRKSMAPRDDTGIPGADAARATVWARANQFAEPD